MPFRLSLYRAREGLGPLTAWDREYREPLGTRAEVRAALDAAWPGLRWRESPGLLFASGAFGGEEHALEVSLFGESGDMLLDIGVYSGPAAVRVLMSALRLNHCYAPESGELRFPFRAGDHWPVAGADQ